MLPTSHDSTVEPAIEREDVVTIMEALMRIDAKADRIIQLLVDEDEEEEDETDA